MSANLGCYITVDSNHMFGIYLICTHDISESMGMHLTSAVHFRQTPQHHVTIRLDYQFCQDMSIQKALPAKNAAHITCIPKNKSEIYFK